MSRGGSSHLLLKRARWRTDLPSVPHHTHSPNLSEGSGGGNRGGGVVVVVVPTEINFRRLEEEEEEEGG